MLSVPDFPPQEKDFAPLSWSSFNPGDLKQDLITLPLEAGLIQAINVKCTHRAIGLWPFNSENANKTSSPTTLPRSTLLPISLGVTAIIYGGLKLSNNDFSLGTQLRGLLHAHLLNEIATSTAKTGFQRKRPFYDAKVNAGEVPTEDDQFSFVSGHTSHAFTFATYTSGLILKYTNNPILGWSYTAAAYATAAWIAQTRVKDHAHNVSDVIAGALVGTIISGAVFYRVQQVDAIHKKTGDKDFIFNYEFIPYTFQDNNNRSWYAGMFEIKF